MKNIVDNEIESQMIKILFSVIFLISLIYSIYFYFMYTRCLKKFDII